MTLTRKHDAVSYKAKPQWLSLVVGVGILALFTVAYVRTAWIAEDAFITFRTLDNALNGLGLTWNPGERVQTYTHPLWLAVLLPLVGIFGDPYYVALVLSYGLLVLTLFIVSRTIDDWNVPAVIAVAALLWSRAFIDYSSSGLENPLVHALLATYLWIWLRVERSPSRTGALMCTTSALFLARPDAVILVAPSLLLDLWTARRSLRAYLVPVSAGAFPAIAWVAFSLFYYGAPVPNTALAKIQTGISWSQKAWQAWEYIKWTAVEDAVTLASIGAGVLSGLIGRSTRLAPFAIGLLVWVAYLFYVGADYMGGRFFSASVLVATVIFAACVVRMRSRVVTWIVVIWLAVNVNSLGSTLFSSSEFNRPEIPPHGIADERGYYYQALGLLLVWEGGIEHPWLHTGQRLRSNPGFYIGCNIGMIGYVAGPQVHLIDPLALSDPFLARLPARKDSRVGHYLRPLPQNYLDSVRDNTNHFKDQGLRELYDDVALATKAPLATPQRLGAIWRLNTGYYNRARTSAYIPEFRGHVSCPS